MAEQLSRKPIPLWLDCDTGHDDALAILLAARDPSSNLLGISTIYGNATLTHTTYNTRAILKAIKREDVGVHVGASKPFCRAAAVAADIHGESGLDGTTCLPTPDVPARPEIAVDAMYKALISEAPGTAYIVATGACTNIALLFSIHPELAEHIAGLSIMGGAIGGGFSDAPMGKVHGQGERFGNWTPWAEFNIYIDPESANAIFSNETLAKKTTLIPLDLTHQFLATAEIQHALRFGFDFKYSSSSSSSPSASSSDSASSNNYTPATTTITTVRKLYSQILTFFAKTYADVFGLTQGPPAHDPLAVAAVLQPDLFFENTTGTGTGNGERFAVQVIIDGEHGASDHVRSNSGSQCGRTVATLLPAHELGVRIPRLLDAEKVWRMLDDCLARVG